MTESKEASRKNRWTYLEVFNGIDYDVMICLEDKVYCELAVRPGDGVDGRKAALEIARVYCNFRNISEREQIQ